MQILPQTARGMELSGAPSKLLMAENDLIYAGRYLHRAWIVSDSNIDTAVEWYAHGYYYEARDRCLLVKTKLKSREISDYC
ncbi:MAG: hypothetical protein ACI94O_000851 [Octadecabacter sp.]|jgi:hypothetical protein